MKLKNSDGMQLVFLFLQALFLSFGGMIFPFLYLFLPAPFLTTSRTDGPIIPLAIFGAVCLSMGLLVTPVAGLLIFTLFGPLILTLDYAIRRELPVDTTIWMAALITVIAMAVAAYTTGFLAEIQSGAFVRELMAVEESMVEEGLIPGNLGFSLSQWADQSLSLLPAAAVLFSLLISYTSFAMTGRRMFLRGVIIRQPNPFPLMSLPRGITGFSLLLVAVLYLLGEQMGEPISLLAANGMVILTGVLFFQGLSVLDFFLIGFLSSSWLRTVLLIFLLMMPGVQIVVTFLGLIEVVFPLRRRIRRM
ncbi:MAG: DUF2232 domain-containing protein [Tissierellia bacterium]|nr:DUF2232 domain-containing protein [Tissierellia bacterium]